MQDVVDREDDVLWYFGNKDEALAWYRHQKTAFPAVEYPRPSKKRPGKWYVRCGK